MVDKKILSGLTVVDVSTVLAGPSVGMFFAELGAKVIKIENEQIPDVTRSWKLPNEDKDAPVSAYFSSINYNKEYQFLNLKTDKGYQAFIKLVQSADILVSNFKFGDAEKMKITDDELHEFNPQLIIGKINGFGETSDRVAYDLILQAETGFMSMNGTSTSGPVKMPVALIDVLAAHHLKEAILLALLEKAKNPKATGKVVTVSLYDAAVSSLVNQASNFLMNNHVPQRIGSLHPNIAPYGELFLTKDQKNITFAIGSEQHFQRLCHRLKLDQLIQDERFESNQKRVVNRIELADYIQKQVELEEAHVLIQDLLAVYVPVGQVKALDEVLKANEIQEKILTEEIQGCLTKRISSIAFTWK